MRSSGFGCCTTKTLSPSHGGCSQEGSMSPSLMTVTPQPSTRPWLESHTVSKGASCPAHPKEKPCQSSQAELFIDSLLRHAGFSERNSFSELSCSLLGCKMLCTRTLGCYFEEIIKLRLQHFSRSLLPSKLKKKRYFLKGLAGNTGFIFALYIVGCRTTERIEKIIFVSKISVTS